MFSGLSINAETTTVQTENSLQKVITLEDVAAGLASLEDFYGKLDPDSIPAAVGQENARERTHVKRLYEDEKDNLNQVVFQNADGTKTLYLFDYPVKYVNERGKITDVSLKIVNDETRSGVFKSSNHNIQTTFGQKAKDGISLNYKDIAITLVPIHANPLSTQKAVELDSVAKQENDSVVSYKYDEKTKLEYSLTYRGFKEDIVVKEYTGQTEYHFKLLTGGLSLTEKNNSYFLTDEFGAVCATIGDIIIFTADEKNNTFGSLSFKEIKVNQEYIITIHIDSEYLKDEKTTYPIKIDPTIEIDYDSAGSGAIHDITLNSNNISNPASTSLSVGRRSDTWGISRILMKFPALDLSGIPSASHISNATVELRDILCETEALTVSCHQFYGSTWYEDNINWEIIWNNVDDSFYIGSAVSSHSIAYANGTQQASSHRYPFNITNLVREWKNEPSSLSQGIIFKATDSVENGSASNYKTIGSYNRSSYRPALYITYSDGTNNGLSLQGLYYINNVNSGYFVHWGNYICGIRGKVSNLNNCIWKIEQVGDAYVIRNSANLSQVIGTSEDPEAIGVQRKILSGSDVPDYCLWYITLASGGGCLIRNKCTGKYMYSSSNSMYTTFDLGNSSLYEQYTPKAWRIISNSVLTTNTELGRASFYDRDVIKNETLNVGYRTTPINAIWSQPEDFIYTTDDSSVAIVTYDGIIQGVATGNTTITAQHKPTGKDYTFSVCVFNPANNLGNISSWCDIERNLVAYWNKTNIKVYINGSENYPDIANACNSAITLWNNALPVQITLASQKSQADILIDIDTSENLNNYLQNNNYNTVFTSGTLGKTFFEYNNENSYFTYNTQKKTVAILTKSKILIASDHVTNSSSQLWTALHELGHALGYLGHSRYDSDIMYYSYDPSNPIETLNIRDITHLTRVYD